MQAATVVLVEDHRLVREGIRHLLDDSPELCVVGEAATGEEAVRLAAELQPAVMLVDIQLPDTSGVDVIRAVIHTVPAVRCVVLSAYDDYVYVTEAFEAGASGYLLKTVGVAELVSAVRAVADGATVIDESISRRLTQRWTSREPTVECLTLRETEVLQLLARGASNKRIAAELGMGVRTVEGHVAHMFAKCGVRSRTEAVLYAVAHHMAAGPGGDAGRWSGQPWPSPMPYRQQQ